MSQIEEKFLEFEHSGSCSKPPKKKRKLNSSKKKGVSSQDPMATLAAQLQVDHFRQVSELLPHENDDIDFYKLC